MALGCIYKILCIFARVSMVSVPRMSERARSVNPTLSPNTNQTHRQTHTLNIAADNNQHYRRTHTQTLSPNTLQTDRQTNGTYLGCLLGCSPGFCYQYYQYYQYYRVGSGFGSV